MGLSQIKLCDFIVCTFDSLIIIQTQFGVAFFSILQKLNAFYKDFMLSKLVTSFKNSSKLHSGSESLKSTLLRALITEFTWNGFLVKLLQSDFLVGTVW